MRYQRQLILHPLLPFPTPHFSSRLPLRPPPYSPVALQSSKVIQRLRVTQELSPPPPRLISWNTPVPRIRSAREINSYLQSVCNLTRTAELTNNKKRSESYVRLTLPERNTFTKVRVRTSLPRSINQRVHLSLRFLFFFFLSVGSLFRALYKQSPAFAYDPEPLYCSLIFFLFSFPDRRKMEMDGRDPRPRGRWPFFLQPNTKPQTCRKLNKKKEIKKTN